MAQNLHFVMIPLMCPGHLIPMVDMAKLLAQRGATVTIVTTPANAKRFASIVNRAIESGGRIHVLELRFPSTEVGLPEGCESAEDLPNFNLITAFFAATDLLQEPLEKKFEELKPRPSCIISDKHLVWTADTAERFQIPWIIFDGMSCFSQLCTHIIYTTKVYESVPDHSKPFVMPGFPDHCIEFTRSQLPGLFSPVCNDMKAIREKIRATESRAYGVVINSFEELEKYNLDEYRKVKGDNVWCIGPLSLCNKEDLDKAQRGKKASINEHECLSWLDSWKQGSVIYACLGSITRLTLPQFIELALGLEASTFPFILVVKGGSKSEEIEKWISEERFEERTKERSLLIRDWAPQVLILSHPAIGGFLTHCGWNSTLEGICAGVVMITWPMFAEQFFNEKLIVQILGTGISVGSKKVVPLGEEENAIVQVGREDLREALRRVMDDGKEGEERRKKARGLGVMAKRSVEEGGSSHLNMTLLINDIINIENNGLEAQGIKGSHIKI